MLKNPLLQQAQASYETGIKERAVYDKIVKDGATLMYTKEVFSKLTAAMKPDEELPEQIAGAVMLILTGLGDKLGDKKREVMLPEPTLLAGMTLVLDAMDFMEQAGLLKVDKETLSAATSTYLNAILPGLGLSPDQMSSMVGSLKETMNNPERMAQYKASLGGKENGLV